MAKGREGRLLLVKLFLLLLFSLFIIIIIILLLCAPFLSVTAGFTFDFCALKWTLSQCFGENQLRNVIEDIKFEFQLSCD